MEERYPYLRFVISMAKLLAGVIAAVVLLGGFAASCRMGGFAGFVQIIVAVLVAAVAYVSAMVWVESMQVFLDIEDHTRELVNQARETKVPPASV